MKRLFATLVTGLPILAAPAMVPSAAQAGQPEVIKPLCLDAGGTFDVDRGHRRCSTVSVTETADAPFHYRNGGGYGNCAGIPPWGGQTPERTGQCFQWSLTHEVTAQVVTTIETTIVRRQHGNGPVQETSSSRDLDKRLEASGCVEHWVDKVWYLPSGEVVRDVQTATPVPLSSCASVLALAEHYYL